MNNQKAEVNLLEEEAGISDDSVIGLFDPELNDFSLDMWKNSDGEKIEKVLLRIYHLQLSEFSKNLFFKILFTNAYFPDTNFTSDEFLDFKIAWLIKERRIQDIENLIIQNPTVGKKSKAIQFLIEEYLSSANIKSACDKTQLIHQDIQNNYLEKFNTYCLIHQNRQEEALLILDLLKERGFKDPFFENKISYLLGYTDETSQKIVDNNLLNFYLSHITIDDFNYEPHSETSKYIWHYLSSANLLNTQNLEKQYNEKTITVYETAASNNSFNKNEIFKIYENFLFNVNQFLNVREAYKTLPSYKARALVYQSILLTDTIDKKLELIFLLKDLFDQDKIFNTYSDKLSEMLQDVKLDEISEIYIPLVKKHSKKNPTTNLKIKFNNKIIHQSKLLRYFLDEDYEKEKTEKDLQNVYKKIKKNKKYFISIKDIILLESLKNDGINLPKGLDYQDLAAKLTIPQGLVDLVAENQTGLVLLKIVEIIGEDKIKDLDPESVYFLSNIFDQLKLKKIRNKIISETLPTRI